MSNYFSSSNYDHYHDHNYQYYYQPCNYDQHEESRYVQYYPNHTQNYSNSYELTPSQPLIGYYYSTNDNTHDFISSKHANFNENNDYFYDPVSTQFVISYSNSNEINEVDKVVDFEEYNPEPFHGGYDINEIYGESLPPSPDICYPPTKISPNVSNIPLSYGNEGVEKPELNSTLEVVNVIDSEADEDGDKEGDVEQGVLTNQENVETGSENEDEEENRGEFDDGEAKIGEDSGSEIRRQIPPGYGIEAMDICDGLFGGYFPCLLKRNEGSCDQCGSEVKLKMDDYYECWRGTVDYWFGNPNPYGGAMPEKGSYGDPVYSYQRHYPQQSVGGEVEYRDNSSWLDCSSNVYYGHNGDY